MLRSTLGFLVSKKTAAAAPPSLVSIAAKVAASSGAASGEWWAVDRDAERLRKLEQHRRSDAYVELHRNPMQTTELGLYGGEAGFEKTPRVWVDPDNPHVSCVFNLTPLAINMSWLRYGHFKRELHIVDIDKLCRHARLVPPVDKLLTDLVTARVALDDDQCSALVRHGARSLVHLVGTRHAEGYFALIQQCFERFLVAIAPPMHAGPRTHADMIRVCALVKKWDEGFQQYHQRALDEAAAASASESAALRREQRLARLHNNDWTENDAEDGEVDADVNSEGDANASAPDKDSFFYRAPHKRASSEAVAARRAPGTGFELDANYYDAVIELCVACDQHDECLRLLRQLIASGHRPRLSTLTNALLSATALRDAQTGAEIHRLLPLYRRRPDSAYFEARAAFAAAVAPDVVWPNLREAIAVAAETVSDRHGGAVASDELQRAAAEFTSAQRRRAAAGWSAATAPDARIAPVGAPGSRCHFITARTVSWSLCALAQARRQGAGTESAPADVVRLLDLLDTRGVACDYEVLTFALLYCARSATASPSSSSSASASMTVAQLVEYIIRVKAPTCGVNITPEMALLAVRALAHLPSSAAPRDGADDAPPSAGLQHSHAELALDAVAAAERTNRHSAHAPALTYELFQLLARLGAMATLTSRLRRYQHEQVPASPAGSGAGVGTAGAPSSWLLRTWLWCNALAAAPNGSHHTTCEALQMLRFQFLGGSQQQQQQQQQQMQQSEPILITRELVAALAMSQLRHGPLPAAALTSISNFDLLVEVDDDDQDVAAQAPPAAEEGEENAAVAAVVVPLRDVLDECFRVIEAGTKREAQLEQQQQAQSLSLSLVEALQGAQQDVQEANSGQSADAQQQPQLQVPPAFDEYDSCAAVAEHLLEVLAADEGDQRRSLLARALWGLPSELDEGTDVSAALSAEFAPTPATLRELRVRWTLVAEDVQLKRLGQRENRPRFEQQMIRPLGRSVEPFDTNLKRVSGKGF